MGGADTPALHLVLNPARIFPAQEAVTRPTIHTGPAKPTAACALHICTQFGQGPRVTRLLRDAELLEVYRQRLHNVSEQSILGTIYFVYI